VPGDQAAHTATDVPLSAYGRGAAAFTGLMDDADVFFKRTRIVGVRTKPMICRRLQVS